MTKLNKTTQKAESWIRQYNESNFFSVKSFYGRCSDEKIRIENDLLEKMHSLDCCDFRILNGNCFYFTCGYVSKDYKKLYVETSCNTFEIDL